MAEIINLNKARKASDKKHRKKKAAENRVEYGTPKPQRQKDASVRTRMDQELDGKRLENSDGKATNNEVHSSDREKEDQ